VIDRQFGNGGDLARLVESRCFFGRHRVYTAPKRLTRARPIWARHAGGSNGSAKYCVSWTTSPFLNSIMLTVEPGRQRYTIAYSVIRRSPVGAD